MDNRSKNRENRPSNNRRHAYGEKNGAPNHSRPRREHNGFEAREERPAPTVNEETVENGAVIGRNAVRELLKSQRTIDKLLVQKGERTGSIVVLVAQAIEQGIPVVETDKAKLDAIAGFAPHQGVIALASEKEYCTVEDILADAQLSEVTAVANGAVYQRTVGFEAWDSPAPSGILGVKWMLKTLHPELYSAEQFTADVQEFYQTFYGFTPAAESIQG